MLLLLSPAKKLNFLSGIYTGVPATQPLYLTKSQKLIKFLKTLDIQEVQNLMKLSTELATINVSRYKLWTKEHHEQNSAMAILAFAGDVYQQLKASTLDQRQLIWAQEHLRIISGLYGILRPLDLIQPYRLEMNINIKIDSYSSLYHFWMSSINTHLKLALKESTTPPLILNLSSNEYSQAVNFQTIKARLINGIFHDWSDGKFQVIGLFAKRARGALARFVIENQITEPDHLKEFNQLGYKFSDMTDNKIIFQRLSTIF